MPIKKIVSTFFIVAIVMLLFFPVIPGHAAKKQPLNKKPAKKASVTRKAIKSRQAMKPLSKNPYLGAIVIDAATNKVLFEDNADAKGYPASVVKLMNFLIILEALEAKEISLKDKITVSAEVAAIGGSEVYLKENEVYTVDDMLYALMVQSANDAAAALALHYKGSKEEFVRLMNKRARGLGMRDTVFRTVNGFPPGKGLTPDVSTPRDITKLSQEVLKHSNALKYTSVKQRIFRAGAQPFVIRNHNHLVRNFEGCDGLKTGYFRAAGFSIAATATKNGNRAIAVIFGSVDRRVRDAKARKLLSQSLAAMEANIAPSHASVAHEESAIFYE